MKMPMPAKRLRLTPIIEIPVPQGMSVRQSAQVAKTVARITLFTLNVRRYFIEKSL